MHAHGHTHLHLHTLAAGPAEDAEVAHEAFMHAYELALPTELRQDLRVPGIQQFAAAVSAAAPPPCPAQPPAGSPCPLPALTPPSLPHHHRRHHRHPTPPHPPRPLLPPRQVWERRRSIPSQTYNDPLDHVFCEFDTDDDGKLTAGEVAAALRARGVDADEALMGRFIEGARAAGGGGAGGCWGLGLLGLPGCCCWGCCWGCCCWGQGSGYGGSRPLLAAAAAPVAAAARRAAPQPHRPPPPSPRPAQP
jgi:hypothetical protein